MNTGQLGLVGLTVIFLVAAFLLFVTGGLIIPIILLILAALAATGVWRALTAARRAHGSAGGEHPSSAGTMLTADDHQVFVGTGAPSDPLSAPSRKA